RRRGNAARADQGGRTGAARRHGGQDGPRRMVRRWPEGEDRFVSEQANATRIPIRRALISVYDKAGLDDLARGLHEAGVELVSTGSTAATIAAAGVPVTKVEELTGFPECLD